MSNQNINRCPCCNTTKIKTMYEKPYSIVECDRCGFSVEIRDKNEEKDGMQEAVKTWNEWNDEVIGKSKESNKG